MTTTSRRKLLTGSAAALFGLSVAASARAQDQDRLPGQLTEDQLGEMIAALGVKPEKKQQRFDFAFTAPVGEQEWVLSMSAVLSQDQKSIWVMAWLNPLPESVNEVPRFALLRLLAENDRLGNGKFFTYIPANRHLVLQRVVPNENMTSAKFKVILQDLGTSVVETHAIWSVESWNQQEGAPASAAAPANATTGTAAQSKAAAGKAAQGKAAQVKQPVRAAENSSKFNQPVRR